jgi:hypothetical protein
MSTEYTVPPDAPRHDCERCEATFATDRHLALHRGLAHGDESLSEAERTAFAEARATEEDELGRYRILALGALVAVYFALLFAYALVT